MLLTKQESLRTYALAGILRSSGFLQTPPRAVS